MIMWIDRKEEKHPIHNSPYYLRGLLYTKWNTKLLIIDIHAVAGKEINYGTKKMFLTHFPRQISSAF
jgi:hypothetical protein